VRNTDRETTERDDSTQLYSHAPPLKMSSRSGSSDGAGAAGSGLCGSAATSVDSPVATAMTWSPLLSPLSRGL
jgi:hypothetical protein